MDRELLKEYEEKYPFGKPNKKLPHKEATPGYVPPMKVSPQRNYDRRPSKQPSPETSIRSPNLDPNHLIRGMPSNKFQDQTVAEA